MSDVLDTPTALVVLPASAVSTIVAADKDDILGKLAEKVRWFKSDASTDDGRAEVRSMAYEIAKTKTALIKIGKGLTEGWRKSTKAVNEECNIVETRLDDLRDTVRAPLTAWENREKDRVQAHETALAAVEERLVFDAPDPSSETISARISTPFPVRNWQEFEARYDDTMRRVTAGLQKMLEVAQKREAEADELIRLRAAEEQRQREDAARAAADRDRRIAAEAAEAARQAAEAEAQRTIATERQKAAQAAEEAARREREVEARAAQAEADRLAAIESAHRAAERAEVARIAAAQQAESDRAAAVKADQARVAQARAAEEAETKRRAANVAHRRKVNNEAVQDLIAAGLTDDLAKAAVKAIALGQIRRVGISY